MCCFTTEIVCQKRLHEAELVILETSLSRQSLALVLTTLNKREKIHQKHKINKLALGK